MCCFGSFNFCCVGAPQRASPSFASFGVKMPKTGIITLGSFLASLRSTNMERVRSSLSCCCELNRWRVQLVLSPHAGDSELTSAQATEGPPRRGAGLRRRAPNRRSQRSEGWQVQESGGPGNAEARQEERAGSRGEGGGVQSGVSNVANRDERRGVLARAGGKGKCPGFCPICAVDYNP